MINIWRPLWWRLGVGVGGYGKNEMFRGVGGGGLTSVQDVQSFFIIIKENWICAVTRHHAEPNINMLLARNLPFDSDARQWSHTLMIPLHCLWAKSNNRTRGQFECNVTWFCFCFHFVRSKRCGCCFLLCLRFQVVETKQADCKLSTKYLNNYE